MDESNSNSQSKITRERFVPSPALKDYVAIFSALSRKTQQHELKYLQAIMHKQLVDVERLKLKERLKKLQSK